MPVSNFLFLPAMADVPQALLHPRLVSGYGRKTRMM